ENRIVVDDTRERKFSHSSDAAAIVSGLGATMQMWKRHRWERSAEKGTELIPSVPGNDIHFQQIVRPRIEITFDIPVMALESRNKRFALEYNGFVNCHSPHYWNIFIKG